MDGIQTHAVIIECGNTEQKGDVHLKHFQQRQTSLNFLQ